MNVRYENTVPPLQLYESPFRLNVMENVALGLHEYYLIFKAYLVFINYLKKVETYF